MRDEGTLSVAERASRRRTPDIGSIIIESLGERWRKYLKELRRCKRAFSEDSVHDVRVATRRLISTLMMIELVLPDARVRRLRRRLKRLFDALSPLRDTQVQILTLEKKALQYPELETLLTVLRVRERNLMDAAARSIMKIETHTLSRTVSALKRILRDHFAHRMMQQSGMNALFGAAAGKFISAATLKEHVIATRPPTIHLARVGFKKLRYTLEALLPLLPALRKQQLKAMDAYQTRMGNIQDAEVLSRVLRRFMQKRPLASRRKLGAFRRELLAQKRELIAGYVQSADDIYGFWSAKRNFHSSS